MSRSNFVETVLIAFGMVAWPILGKYSHAAAPWVAFLAMSFTAAVVALLALIQGQFGAGSIPPIRAVFILAIAGFLNGAAMYRYTARTSSVTQTGRYLVLVAVLVVLEAPIVDFLLNRAWLTPRQWFGVACGVACVYFLNQK